jgi:septum formation protein
MKKIILASKSPRRKEILSSIIDEFEIVESDYTEDITLDMPPDELAMYLAKGKALDVAKNNQGIIISADTFIVLKNKVLGKPKNEEDAIKMLKMLSGKKHVVYTGIALIDTENNHIKQGVEKTSIHFRKLTDAEIIKYVKTKEPLDKAGSYAIQGKGMILISKINGCYTNVIGLPVNLLKKLLESF